MTHTTPLTALRHDYLAAQERCPHWDYDNPDGAREPCCRQMNAAEDAYRAARQAKRGAL